MLVQDLDGGYTAYEIRSGDDPVENGVPIYRTKENALALGRHTWLINYAAWNDGVSPDWKDTNWKVETFILEQENIDNGLSMSTFSIDDKGKRPAPPPSLPPSHSKRPKTTNELDGKNS